LLTISFKLLRSSTVSWVLFDALSCEDFSMSDFFKSSMIKCLTYREYDMSSSSARYSDRLHKSHVNRTCLGMSLFSLRIGSAIVAPKKTSPKGGISPAERSKAPGEMVKRPALPCRNIFCGSAVRELGCLVFSSCLLAAPQSSDRIRG